MVAYSFKGRFAEPIAARTKQQTIRAIGKKRHTRPGERMTMTTGDRYHPRTIGSATCQAVDGITINLTAPPGGILQTPQVAIAPADPPGVYYIADQAELDAFAVLDGFSDWADLEAFWRKTHPGADTFTGIRIFWGDTFVPATPPAGD